LAQVEMVAHPLVLHQQSVQILFSLALLQLVVVRELLITHQLMLQVEMVAQVEVAQEILITLPMVLEHQDKETMVA
tara:strand:- start:322 stop:549 length:228 start_codon:yes stop_codon:yes gene_type:complete